MRILLVEDDRTLASRLSAALERERYVVETSFDGSDAHDRLGSERYDLVILDTGLPRMRGQEVLQRLRKRNADVPVMMLLGEGDSMESGLLCLDAGADDCLRKPLVPQEFGARVRALLRRPHQRRPVLRCGSLEFDSNARMFSVEGRPLSLTPREHSVLESLMQRAGHALSKSDIAGSLYTLDDDISLDSIEIFVHRLRKKLGDCGAGIVTLRGIGYLLKPCKTPERVQA